MAIPHHLRQSEARRYIEARVGPAALAKLRQPNRLIDYCALIGVPLWFGLNIAYLAWADFGFVSVLVMFVQGMLAMWSIYVYHELIVHRNVVRGRLARWVGVMLTLPVQFTATGYRHAHMRHHRHLSQAADTEIYKCDVDTSRKRLFFSTFLGAMLCMRGAFSATKGRHYPSLFESRDPEVLKQYRQEKMLLKIFTYAGLPILLLLWPKGTALGYLLPLLIVTPLINSLRLPMEHMEMDTHNPIALGTCYRTGFLTRWFFFWSAGDCHLLHHIYPGIPFYRMDAALKLLAPVIAEAGVVQRHSFIGVLRLWFVSLHPHGTAPVREAAHHPRG